MRGLIRITGLAAAVAAMLVLVASAAGQPGTPPALAWSPSSHDYGTIDASSSGSQEFTLTNSGGSASGMLSISLSGSAAFSITADACTGTSLGPGKSCAVTVEYAPATAGQSDTATLTASGKRLGTADASASLTGASTAGVPDLTLSPGTRVGTGTAPKDYFFDFGPVASATQTFTVTNNGTGASNTLTVIGGDPPRFVLSNDTCSAQALAPSGTCTFDITATAPAGCNPGDPFGAAPVDVIGIPFAPYIHLTVFGSCPFS